MAGPSESGGVKGERGVAGPSGSRGLIRHVGTKGSKADHRNWKQSPREGAAARDNGLIKVYNGLESKSFFSMPEAKRK